MFFCGTEVKDLDICIFTAIRTIKNQKRNTDIICQSKEATRGTECLVSARKSCKCPNTPSNLWYICCGSALLKCLSLRQYQVLAGVTVYLVPPPHTSPGQLVPRGQDNPGYLVPYTGQLAPPPPPGVLGWGASSSGQGIFTPSGEEASCLG